MTTSYLLGVDLGTTGTRAVLYDAGGALISHGRAGVSLYHPQPGVVEQNAEDFYTSAVAAVRECLQGCRVDPSRVAGLAFDSQMAGIGTIDEDFQPATRFDSWLDMRCQPYIDELNRNHADRITSLTGCPPTCDHGPKILWWMHDRPEEYRRVAKFVTPACYVAGRVAALRAEQAYMDYTFLHFTCLSDAQKGTWSSELCELLEVDQDRLPRIVAPWEVIGEVQPEAARDFGLAPGTPVAAGCGDTAAGALGAGVVRPGMLLDIAGTASVLACSTDRFVADRENRALLTMRSVVAGIWNPLAYIAGGGLALRWLRDQFLNHGHVPADANQAYERMIEVARQAPPGCDGLVFSPHLGGRICPAAPEMRGAWVGFSWGHTQAHFYRAVLESVAYEYAWYLRILRGLLPDLHLIEARAIGGGAQNRAWNQMKADILDVPYQRVLRAESATWGSALVAGKAVGLFDDLACKASHCASVSGELITPDQEGDERYRLALERYLAWEPRLKDGFEHLTS